MCIHFYFMCEANKNIYSLVFSWIPLCIDKDNYLFDVHPALLKNIKCPWNWWRVFKRTYNVFLNEKSFQQYLILAIFLCLLLELIGQPGQTLLKFKGSTGKRNGFVLLWILNVAIFVCYSIICSHMSLKMYGSFRPNFRGQGYKSDDASDSFPWVMLPKLSAYHSVARSSLTNHLIEFIIQIFFFSFSLFLSLPLSFLLCVITSW